MAEEIKVDMKSQVDAVTENGSEMVNGALASASNKRALYLLQIKRSKLNEESMRALKCYLLHILRTTLLQHIVIEIYFD